MNIAFVSSQGGHSGQIKLIFNNDVIGNNRAIFITETPDKNRAPREKSFNGKFKTYFFKKDSLGFNPVKYIITTIQLIKLFKREQIDLIVTNCAQLSIPACLAAKLSGIKTIFIDTVIRVKTPNWSARACYLISDIFLVQHENMAKKYGKRAIFRGGIV